MPLPKDLAASVEWVDEGVGLLKPAAGHPGAASLVLDEGSEVVLVDAGLAPAQRRKLSPHVDVCLLTHAHVPHAHGARDFREVWAPREEARALLSAEDFLETYEVARRDRDVVSSAIRKAGYEPSPVHKQMRPGGILKLDRSEWHLLAAPGHSPGMLALLDPVRHILFAADLDEENAAWYGFPNSDPTALEATAMQLADVPVAVLLASHAAPRRRGIKQMLRGVAESIRERDRKVLAALEHPRSLDELADLGLCSVKSTAPLARYHERIMVEKHLARLMEKDFVAARQDGRFQRVA
ncbi:MAG TPA: MBL fold metallo-hydrolase [Candidatus Thermoplasmatota archaeon]|nr:MBL fold metallo-hydrolase [Candidatus Thermoplasmatota archaeon]